MAKGSAPVEVGFVGLGNMGRPMARRLEVPELHLSVYNRTTAKCGEFADRGCTVASVLADLRHCTIIFTMLGTDDDVEHVYLAKDGLVATTSPGTTLVDCSTISAEMSAQVRARCENAGLSFLAAPVAGGPPIIEGGGLAMAVSGDRGTFEAAGEVLRKVAPRAVYVGPGETSRLVKICHNLLVAATLEVLGELCVLAEAKEVERSALLSFLQSTAISSRFIEYKAPLLESLDFTAAFTSRLMQKDLDLGLSLAKDVGVAMPVATQVRDTFKDANDGGLADLDASSIYLHLAAVARGGRDGSEQGAAG
ncbi:NAD(P)-dependent oxidoreductase [Nocardioides sp. J54]|uniref:NAD(P)-dependent oxidoreductase n=1 Tax=Nocardioides sp. J54 TaxID=935866 RepID=UPI0012FB31F4|nr:NAD(P)-dependent oxidoreductase [Nocardioides sp. J54]